MSYTPNNTDVYLRAAAGFMAGIAASAVTDTLAGDFSLYAQMADAYAQQLDTSWGVTPTPTNLELFTIQEVSEAVWENRSPPPTVNATTPGTYTQVAQSVIARVQQINAQVISQGIDPNGPGTPGTGTVTSVSATAPLAVTASPTVAPVVAASAFTGSGLAHVTAGVLDVAADLGFAPGAIPVTNAGATDVVFRLIGGAGTIGASGAMVINLSAGGASIIGSLPNTKQDPQNMAGDVTGTTALSVVAKVNGATVPAAGALTPGNVAQVTDVSALGYGAINLAGGANFVTGVLPVANQARQVMGGDVTGTTAASVVAAVQGQAISANQAINLLAAFIDGWGATNVHADSPVALTAAAPIRAFNTAGGTIQYNTPAAPFDGMVIGIKAAVAGATPATLHANNGGGETVEDPTNSGNYAVTVNIPGQGPMCKWKYRVSDTKWIGWSGV